MAPIYILNETQYINYFGEHLLNEYKLYIFIVLIFMILILYFLNPLCYKNYNNIKSKYKTV